MWERLMGIQTFGALGLSVERRRGRFYLFLRKRIHGRLHGRYVRRLSVFDAVDLQVAKIMEKERRTKCREQSRWQTLGAAAVLAAGQELDREADRHFRAVMYLTGHHLHKRSTWRLRRGNPSMRIEDVFEASAPPEASAFSPMRAARPAIINPCSPDPEIQKILDRAAAGDGSVLPQVRQMLQHQAYVDGLGDVASFALDKLINEAAGDNIAVREGIRAKYEQTLANLLADGGLEPTFAEELAATRAAHATITVNTLELLASRQEPSSAAAIAFERHLGRAERRLAGALKALAALRRLRKRVVRKQINVAKTMVVDNRGVDGFATKHAMAEASCVQVMPASNHRTEDSNDGA